MKEQTRVQTRMLTLIESQGNIYSTKENLNDKLSKVKEDFNEDLKDKVDYDKLNKQYLNKQGG